LNEFDKRFANNEISLIKKLDFIFWVAGKFWETETEYFKNKEKIKEK
jgi:hypothetical protein